LRKKKNFISSYEPASIPEQSTEHDEFSEEERLMQLYHAIKKLNQVEKAIVIL